MQVLIANQSHFSNLTELHQNVFQALHPDASPESGATQGRLRARNEINSGLTLLAYDNAPSLDNNSPAHLLGRCVLHENFTDVIHLSRLYFMPQYRRQGTASALVLSALLLGTMALYRILSLDTIASLQPACNLYRKLHFTELSAQEASIAHLWPNTNMTAESIFFIHDLPTTIQARQELTKRLQGLSTSLEPLPARDELRGALRR